MHHKENSGSSEECSNKRDTDANDGPIPLYLLSKGPPRQSSSLASFSAAADSSRQIKHCDKQRSLDLTIELEGKFV